jgi:ABC-type dipeptide/oligopeptide/nickel transport system permease subunit
VLAFVIRRLLALTILLVGLNYLSDALRDALDPRRANLR